MNKVTPLFIGGLTTLCTSALAADELNTFQSFAGYTGLINTPNAHVLNKGVVDIGYNNQLDFRGQKYIDGHNLVFSAGLFERLEVSGFVASNSMHDNMFYSEGKGQIRDLSFNVKYQVPFIPKDWFSVAVGAKDIEGAANKYKTFYAVASKQLWDFRFSAGVGTTDRVVGQMDGVFAGVEWQPLEWFSLLTEYDAEAVNAAARVTIPKAWLYDIGEITLTSRFYSSTDFSEDESNYWGVNFTIPLSDEVNYSQPSPAPTQESPLLSVKSSSKQIARSNPSKLSTVSTDLSYSTASNDSHATKNNKSKQHIEHSTSVPLRSESIAITEQAFNKQALALKTQLAKDGFENVAVAYSVDKQVYIEFENATFNRNDIDALGLVLGRVSEIITVEDAAFHVQLNKYNIALFTLQGNVDNYREFIINGYTPDITISQKAITPPGGLTWIGATYANSPYFKPRLTLSPTISNTYATELGVYDYSLAIKADFEVPLWQGAGAIISGQAHVSNSDDYEKNAPFKNLRKKSGLTRAALHQTFKLPYGFYNQTQIGFFKEYYDFEGITNETAWLSEQGRHKLSAKLGYFEYQDYQASEEYQTLSYQYNWLEKNITLHAQAGNYFYKDSGFKLESRFWFGDSYLAIFYEDTSAQKAGASISIPLTPRKDMAATRYGQVKGTSAYKHSIATQIGQSHNRLVFNQGYAPSTAINLDNSILNQGRASTDYIYANLARLKNAYIEYK